MGWIASGRLWAAVLGAWLCVGLPLPLSLGGAAWAAKTPTRVEASIVRRFTLVKTEDLTFGNLIVAGTAGTVTINPGTDARVTSAGITPAGGEIHAAQFFGYGTPNTLVWVRWSTTPPYTLTRVGGGATMLLDQLTTNSVYFVFAGSDPRIVPANGILDVRFGGRLQVNANQMAGEYVGTFPITVDYP